MSLQRRVALGVIGWLALVSVLHLWLNTRVFDFSPRTQEPNEFRVGFLPVT